MREARSRLAARRGGGDNGNAPNDRREARRHREVEPTGGGIQKTLVVGKGREVVFLQAQS